MPSLKNRKIIYTVLVVPSIIPWVIMSFIGITLGIGLLGLAGIFGFRSIYLLPVLERKQRRTYNILLSLGIVSMALYVVFMLANITAEWISMTLLVSGLILLLVAVSLLIEINYLKIENSDKSPPLTDEARF